MTSTNDIRRGFLHYFEGQGHARVQSAPLMSAQRPHLMFVNAGMVPFKNVFTGLETRPYVTAASSQKCVRAGASTTTSTMSATPRATTPSSRCSATSRSATISRNARSTRLDLLTAEFGLSPDRLTVTVYHTDDEAFDLWRKIAGCPTPHHPHRHSDNFWAMGDTGPCGPCSRSSTTTATTSPAARPVARRGRRPFRRDLEPRVHAVRAGGRGRRVDLPRPSIDTGMGLERIAAVMQGVHDNYDTDTFRALIAPAAR
jgi:alanyl-tRNA synthetase